MPPNKSQHSSDTTRSNHIEFVEYNTAEEHEELQQITLWGY